MDITGEQSEIEKKTTTILLEVCGSKQAKLLCLSLFSLLTSSCLHALGSTERGDKSVPCHNAERQACACGEQGVKEGDGRKRLINVRY